MFLKERLKLEVEPLNWEGHTENGGFDYLMTHVDPALGGRHGDIGLEIGRNRMDTISVVRSIDTVPIIFEITGIEKLQNPYGIELLNNELSMSREDVFGEIYDYDFSTIDSSLQ